jgi:hypothetical protein
MHLAVTWILNCISPILSFLTPQIHRFHHPFPILTSLSKRVGPLRAEDLFVVGYLWYTMRQWEFQALRDELLDVWSFDLVRCDFDDFENLRVVELAAQPFLTDGERLHEST